MNGKMIESLLKAGLLKALGAPDAVADEDLDEDLERLLAAFDGIDVETYEEAGVLTRDAGLVVTTWRGAEERTFQITVVER